MKNIKYQILLANKEQFHLNMMTFNESFNKNTLGNYILAYMGELDSADEDCAIGELFEKFNICIPDDYKFRSLSSGDIVVVNGTMYYCKSIGWDKIN